MGITYSSEGGSVGEGGTKGGVLPPESITVINNKHMSRYPLEIRKKQAEVNRLMRAWDKKNGYITDIKSKERMDNYQQISLETAENRGKGWGEYEINYLRKNYKKMTALEIALKLGRTRWGVTQKLKKLRLFVNDHYETL